jgi:nitric oxide reductase NorD protein
MTQNDAYMFMRSLEASLDKKTELESERGTSLYPEWGDDLQDYRHNWTRIREQTHQGTSLSFYKETTGRHAGLLKKIRREFQMLKPEGFTRLKRQYDGDDIDLDAVVDFLVDRKAGISPSEKNYTLIQKRQRDIAVAFLIDMSRSTRGRTIRQEKESLIIMSEALHEVGDAFAVYGFSGNNRDNVDFYRIKDFDDSYDDRVKKRISAIEDRFENRDGTAIRHTIGKLRRRPERTKLLILLSDGKPVDKEYSGAYAIEDTRMALKEAQRFGIRTFCITVDKSAPEYLPRMYSHSSWTVIDDVARLPEKITRIYRMLTA